MFFTHSIIAYLNACKNTSTHLTCFTYISIYYYYLWIRDLQTSIFVHLACSSLLANRCSNEIGESKAKKRKKENRILKENGTRKKEKKWRRICVGNGPGVKMDVSHVHDRTGEMCCSHWAIQPFLSNFSAICDPLSPNHGFENVMRDASMLSVNGSGHN